MVLYEVRNGVISPMSVVRETKTGWRLHNGGFINRSRKGKTQAVAGTFYTTSKDEAVLWSKQTTSDAHHLIQVIAASKSDLELWVELGSQEENLPKSRWQTWRK